MISGPQIVTRVYDLLLYLLPQIAKFPRAHRFQLGAHFEKQLYEIFEGMITASYTRERLPLLRRLNIQLEHCRHWLRLCKDLRLLSLQRYEVASRHFNDIGVQLGGWIKQQGRTT